jgi:hypothetical protein
MMLRKPRRIYNRVACVNWLIKHEDLWRGFPRERITSSKDNPEVIIQWKRLVMELKKVNLLASTTSWFDVGMTNLVNDARAIVEFRKAGPG